MRGRRWCACFAVAVLLLMPIGVAGAKHHPEDTVKAKATFTVTSRLVLVDVVVRHDGKPVCGLKPQDFEVREDRKPQAIQSFEAHCGSDAVERHLEFPRLPADTYSNVPDAPVTGAVNVLLLDGLNTRTRDEMRAREEMIESLRTLPRGVGSLSSHWGRGCGC